MLGSVAGGALSAGASILGGIFGGISTRKQLSKIEKGLNEKKDNLTKEYTQEKSTNFLDTDTARATLALLRRQNQQQAEAMNNNAVKAGASDEAKVAMAARLNRNYADAASQIAGMGTQYKQNLKNNYQAQVNAVDDSIRNIQLQKAKASSDMIGSVTQGANQLIGAFMEEK